MQVLLTAINAKYIHSNLGIYSLKAYAEEKLPGLSVQLAEYTINHRLEAILQDIYKRKPDFIGFSCYIWNIGYVKALLADIRKVLPDVQIWLGGPEVSYDGEKVLAAHPEVFGIMKGEGEETFTRLMEAYSLAEARGRMPDEEELQKIPGLLYRNRERSISDTGYCQQMDMDTIPFPYETMDMKELEHRIIYYESSRGCPFSCSYCLSSIDKRVRMRSTALVKRELDFFLKAKVPQVKFVDRTFNCNKRHAMEIWQYIHDNDNGVTNFHFEIAADLLDEEELKLLGTMRPGLVQLEIGVQSTNEETLSAIRRKTDIEKIGRITARINRGHNIHQHLDLIAGLPYEDLDSFRISFNRVYAMEPEQLQLGFLKVLKGSYMAEMAKSCDIRFSENPPYEVLSTGWLSYDDVLELKGVEEMTEVYYNSRQFTQTLPLMEQLFSDPYQMFLELWKYYTEEKIADISHSRIARYEILFRFLEMRADSETLENLRDQLMIDLYLRENSKKRPFFAREQSAYKDKLRAYAKEAGKTAHLEVLQDGTVVLFDYEKRDPLTKNAGIRFFAEEKPEKEKR